MPTESEFQELIDNCTCTWTKRNGVNGCEVKSKKNGNSIFLPAAGFWYNSPNDQGSLGDYWSSTPYETCDACGACGLYFDSDVHGPNWNVREFGQSVRPVAE